MEIEPAAFGSHHWSRQSFVNELSNPRGHYFVMCSQLNDRLIGYAGFWLVGQECHITTLAVHPACRRLHLGERLLSHLIGECEQAGALWMTLEVRVSNEAAQRLYCKWGFKSLGVRRSYYKDNSEDALVLWTESLASPAFRDRLDDLRARLAREPLQTGSAEHVDLDRATQPPLELVPAHGSGVRQRCEGRADVAG